MKNLLVFFMCVAFVLAVNAHADHPDDVYWERLSPPGWDLDNGPSAMTVYDGKLIVGGYFTAVGSLTVNNVAAWDGASWSALGSGTNGIVRALAVYNGQLIAGGGFSSAGGVTVDNVAAFDGASWSAMGDVGEHVYDLVVFDGDLVASNTWYDPVYQNYVGHVIAWTGTSWSLLGSFEMCAFGWGLVYALTVYDGKLIAGGAFDCPADFIAAYDGVSWSALGAGLGNIVYSLSVYDDQLVAGLSSVHVWDGVSWGILGSGFPYSDLTAALTVHNGELIAGGLFPIAGADTVNNIAAWDGTSWSSLGSGVNDGVSALATYDGDLVVGGAFTTAGDKSAPYLARWTKPNPTAVNEAVLRARQTVQLNQNIPNPFNPVTTITYILDERSLVSLNVFDVNGKLVKRLLRKRQNAGEYNVEWDGRNDIGKVVSSGVYFYVLQAGSTTETRKMVLLK